MDLGFDPLSIPTRGRRAEPASIGEVRDLTAADLHLLNQPNTSAASTPALQRISERHHALARHLAAGVSEQEAAYLTGYDISRISILKHDPAFQELLAFYRGEAHTRFIDVIEHMAGLSKDSLVELRGRLEENPAGFSNNELLKMVTELRDRTAEHDEDTEGAPTRIELVAPDDDSETSTSS